MDWLWELVASIAVSFGKTLVAIAPYVAVAAVVFPILSLKFACNSGVPWWRRRELVTDLCYWFVIPIFTRFMRIGLMVLGAALFFGIYAAEDIVAFYDNGHGPLAELPFWIQLGIYLVVSDFMLFWSHRLFHGLRLWKYHAIHHSPEDVDWISAARFHPVNLTLGAVLADVVLLLAGIAPAVLSILTPFNVIMSAFVHANLNWTLGPFKYVIAGPVFHRWHHTAADRGGSMNFAATFPVFDLLFGTFYMPKNELPSDYGIGEPDFPSSFGGQLLYPFRDRPAGAVQPALMPARAPAES